VDTGFDPGSGPNLPVHTVAVQPDGKIIIGGQFTSVSGSSRVRIARLNPDGPLDVSFDPGAGADLTVVTTAIQPDGKILVVGNSSNGLNGDIVLVRYKSNGRTDFSFGLGGKVITDLRGNESANSTAVLANGKILVAGSFDSDFVLLRYNKNGSLDSSFGTNGVTVTNFDSNDADIAYSLAVQADGKIVLAGSSDYDNRILLARYKTNGAPDQTGEGGAGKFV